MKKYIIPKTGIVRLKLNDSILEGAGIGTASIGTYGSSAMSKKNKFFDWEEENSEKDACPQNNIWE